MAITMVATKKADFGTGIFITATRLIQPGNHGRVLRFQISEHHRTLAPRPDRRYAGGQVIDRAYIGFRIARAIDIQRRATTDVSGLRLEQVRHLCDGRGA